MSRLPNDHLRLLVLSGLVLIAQFGVACGVVGILALPRLSGVGVGATLAAQFVAAASVVSTALVAAYVTTRFVAPAALAASAADPSSRGLRDPGVERELRGLVSALSAAAVSARQPERFSDTDGAVTTALRPPEAECRDYGRFLHAVLDGIESQVCILDSAGRIVEANRAWNAFVEATGDQRLGRHGASFLEFCSSAGVYDQSGGGAIYAAVSAVLAGDETALAGGFSANVAGQQRWVEIQVKPLPTHERGAVIVIQDDRTERRLAEDRLRLQNQRAETLASALEASQASLELAMRGGELGLWHWDVATGHFELSGDCLEPVGLGPGGRIAGAHIDLFRDRVHPDETVFWTPEDAASLAPDEPYDRQFRLRRPDGSYHWFQALGRASSVDGQGAPDSLSGVLIDIDARKSDELHDAGMAKIIEESFNEVFVFDRATGKFLEVNRGARENLGYSLEELRELKVQDIKLPGTESELAERLAGLDADPAGRVEYETTHLRQDGTSYPVMMTAQSSRLMDRDVIVGIGVDLTARRALESQLAEAHRLESIGQLAAGIAHEMNTPLQFVGNNIQFLSQCSETLFEVIEVFQNSIDPDDAPTSWVKRYGEIRGALERTGFNRIRAEAPKAIEESLEGVARVLQIVRAMKDFSHPGGEEKAPTDLNRALQSTATITRNRWKLAGELDLRLDADLPFVECFGGAINQVFVNLIVNAADALADRRAAEPDAPEGEIVVSSRRAGDHVVVEVRDNGPGMPEEVRRRAFDPFFTTKEVGKGTGQGLSLCHAIVVKNHGGSIGIESVEGEGTTVRVRLPVTAGVPNPAPAVPVATTLA